MDQGWQRLGLRFEGVITLAGLQPEKPPPRLGNRSSRCHGRSLAAPDRETTRPVANGATSWRCSAASKRSSCSTAKQGRRAPGFTLLVAPINRQSTTQSVHQAFKTINSHLLVDLAVLLT